MAFSGRPARGVRNRYMDEMRGAPLPDFPLMNPLTGPLKAASTKSGTGDFISLWSGQGVSMNREETTGEVVERLASEALRLLGQ